MAKLLQELKKYEYVGLRTCTKDENYKVGDICRNSYDWDYENDCSTYGTSEPIELDGTCCIDCEIKDYDIDSFEESELLEELYKSIFNYGNGNKILVGGNIATCGDDDGEIIIRNAVVLHIFQKNKNISKTP